jgi:hypothetical protein
MNNNKETAERLYKEHIKNHRHPTYFDGFNDGFNVNADWKAEFSEADIKLNNIIRDDMQTMSSNDTDGLYDSTPVTRIYRDGGIVRCYAISSYGGVCIVSRNGYYQIVTLGEDDDYHFLNSADIYCGYFGNKADFVNLLSEALSIFNNNKTE